MAERNTGSPAVLSSIVPRRNALAVEADNGGGVQATTPTAARTGLNAEDPFAGLALARMVNSAGPGLGYGLPFV